MENYENQNYEVPSKGKHNRQERIDAMLSSTSELFEQNPDKVAVNEDGSRTLRLTVPFHGKPNGGVVDITVSNPLGDDHPAEMTNYEFSAEDGWGNAFQMLRDGESSDITAGHMKNGMFQKSKYGDAQTDKEILFWTKSHLKNLETGDVKQGKTAQERVREAHKKQSLSRRILKMLVRR